MRSEKEMMDLVLSLAEQDERIRIVTLEGSRANINIPKDEFQDYDITYFVSDIEHYIYNDERLNKFVYIIKMKKVSLNDIGDEINAKKRNGSIDPTNVLCITCFTSTNAWL